MKKTWDMIKFQEVRILPDMLIQFGGFRVKISHQSLQLLVHLKKTDQYVEKKLRDTLKFIQSHHLMSELKEIKKKLYLPALNGEKKYVIDVDIPFDKPKNSDLVINTENQSPADVANKILKKIRL